MATINSHEASPSTSRWSYAAYLSFRGVDTRKTFTEHLYRALMGKGLHTFKDDVELKRGEALIPQCKKAIEGSRVSIIVLSKNYASSMWCLEELVIILKRRSSGHSVIPVFYDVGPNEVGNQTGSFKEAFMRHERRIETVKGKQKEYLGKVQAWRMALKEVTNLAGIYIFNAKISGPVYIEVITEFVTTNNRAHPGRQDRSDFCESLIEDERTRGKRSRDEISSHVCGLDILQRHFGKKRKDAAESLGISVSTLKRYCRYYNIPRWPNKKRNNVSGLPNPYGEKNPLPTFNTLSTNGQITVENEVGGQNLEPNECLPDSFEDPNFQNTRIGSISEFGKTPTFYDSLPGHCHDAEVCFSAVCSETEAAGGSSQLVFQLEGQTTQYTAYSNSNAPVFPQPQIASEEVLNENGGSSEDRRDSFASQAEASFEGHVSESSNLTVIACSDAAAPNQTLAMMPIPHLTGGSSKTFQLEKEMGGQIPEPNEFLPDSFEDPSFWNIGHDSIVEIGKILTFDDSFLDNTEGSSKCAFQLQGQTTQFPAYPIPDDVSQLQIASTEVLSENMGNSEDGRILLASHEASQEEAFLEGRVFESNNLTVPACSDAAAPSQPLATILHTMPTIPSMVPHHIGGSSEFPGCPNLSGIVDPHPQIASTQILSENMGTLEDLSIFLVSQEEPFMEEYGSGSINQTIPSCLDPAPSQQPRMPPLIASQDTSSVRVKATNGHTTIAFKLSFASGIIQLKEEVSKRLGFELGNINLKYKDADGDLVSIVCDDDVRDYLQLLTSLGNQVSKLFVS